MAVFKSFDILPSYAKTFIFSWELNDDFVGDLPWKFTIQFGFSPDGPWENLNNIPVENAYLFFSSLPFLVDKSRNLYFRVKFVAGTGTNAKTFYSHIRTPYTDLSREEFLLAADIMRRELLQLKNFSGSKCFLWIKSNNGAKCNKCLDPITKDVLLQNCEFCFGTGIYPPYYGPYLMWLNFSPYKNEKGMSPDGLGERQPVIFECTCIGVPVFHSGDIVVDLSSDKRYEIFAVQSLFEIRRFTVLQKLVIKELPITSILYKLNQDHVAEDSCLPPVVL